MFCSETQVTPTPSTSEASPACPEHLRAPAVMAQLDRSATTSQNSFIPYALIHVGSVTKTYSANAGEESQTTTSNTASWQTLPKFTQGETNMRC